MENTSPSNVIEYLNPITKVSIKFRVLDNDRGIDIIDSYEYNDEAKMDFLKYIFEHFPLSFGKRDIYSLLVEWKAHNILYKKGLFKKHTVNACLDAKEKWYRRFGFRVVCFIFNEK